MAYTIDLNWLEGILQVRLLDDKKSAYPPAIKDWPDSAYKAFLLSLNLLDLDRLLLALSLSPIIAPNALDDIIQKNIKTSGEHPQLGGIRSAQFRGFLPTAQTFLFLVAGDDIDARLKTWHWLRTHSVLIKNQVISIEKPADPTEPFTNGVLKISAEWAEEILYGEAQHPTFSMDFPAKKTETNLNWEDIVLAPQTQRGIDELIAWMARRDELQNLPVARYVKPGYRALFYGPPGTGKTLAASLLGKHTGTEVFAVDLSMVVSKYIGETEKNLSRLFDKARNRNWILFFDEADALFGKRTGVRDAHDKYANQEVAYLLQRIEDFPGLVILASNLKNNIDEAFLRRFQSVIHFPVPNARERQILWHKALQQFAPPTLVLKKLATTHELSGAAIINAAQYAGLAALSEKRKITERDLLQGIQRELQKEGKVV